MYSPLAESRATGCGSQHIMVSMTLFILAAGSLVLLYIVVSRRRIAKIWLILWGISPVVAVYILNPDFRVYSFHSFMHGGIVYQILNGNIPPFDPLVAGYSARYPWGPHLVAAAITWLLGISPFYSMALMNVVSLCVVMVLIYRISHLMTADERGSILAVVCSLFAVTLFVPEMLRLVPTGFDAEIRGVPAIHKFITINTLPTGLVFFLLALHSALKLFRNGGIVTTSAILLISTLATGFFYPAFLPGVAASVIVGVVAIAVIHITGRGRGDIRRTALTVGTTAAAFIILGPYLSSVGGGTISNLTVFNPPDVGRNLIRYLILTVPILVVVLIRLRSIANDLGSRGLFIIATVTVATAGSYVMIHLPFDNEYKLLVLSSVALGILGGAGFNSMLGRRRQVLVVVTIGLFLIPSFRIIHLRASRGGRTSSRYVEAGRNIDSADKEENELYRWIRENTAPNSVLIDTELEPAVLAQRQLFIGIGAQGRLEQKGFGRVGIILQLQSGYDPEVLGRRRRIVERIYSQPRSLTQTEWEELHDLPGDVYAVVRSEADGRRLEQEGFRRVFLSSGGNYRLYEVSKTG